VILQACELLKNQVWKDTFSEDVTIQHLQQHSIKHAIMIMEDKEYLATPKPNLCFTQYNEVTMEAHFVFTQMHKKPGKIL